MTYLWSMCAFVWVWWVARIAKIAWSTPWHSYSHCRSGHQPAVCPLALCLSPTAKESLFSLAVSSPARMKKRTLDMMSRQRLIISNQWGTFSIRPASCSSLLAVLAGLAVGSADLFVCSKWLYGVMVVTWCLPEGYIHLMAIFMDLWCYLPGKSYNILCNEVDE